MLLRMSRSMCFIRAIVALSCSFALANAAEPAVAGVSQATDVAPIQLGIAVSFAAIMLALAGAALNHPRFVFLGSTTAVVVSGFSLLAYLAIYSRNTDPM